MMLWQGAYVGIVIMEDSEYILWWRQEVLLTNFLIDFPKLSQVVHTCH